MKRVNIYRVDLRNQKVDGPQYLNVDFIQNKIDSLNLMINPPSSLNSKLKDSINYKDFQTPKIIKYDELVSKFKSSQENTSASQKTFKIKLMTLNNYYYDSEVLLVFDGYNVYKYIEDKKNE